MADKRFFIETNAIWDNGKQLTWEDLCNILNKYPILTTQRKVRAWPKQHVQIKMLERLSILYRCKINK